MFYSAAITHIAWWGLFFLYCTEAQDNPTPDDLAITRFTLGKKSGILASAARSVGSTPTLSCLTNSNAEPLSISVTRQRTGETIAETQSSELVHTFGPLRCNDTDIYICTVAHQDLTTRARMDLSVLCSPELVIEDYSEELDSPFYNGTEGGTLSVEIKVIGSPPPNQLSLSTVNTKRLITSISLSRDTDEASDQTPYQLTYSTTTPPYGSVVLTFRSLTAEDIGKLYSLEVSNGRIQTLKYTFFIRAVLSDTEIDQLCRSVAKSTIPEVVKETESNVTKKGEPCISVAEPNIPPAESEKEHDSGGFSLDTPTLALGSALLFVCLLVSTVVIWIVCTAKNREGGGIKAMIQKRMSKQRQKTLLRDEMRRSEGTTESVKSTELCVFENSVYEQRPTTGKDHQRQQQQHKEITLRRNPGGGGGDKSPTHPHPSGPATATSNGLYGLASYNRVSSVASKTDLGLENDDLDLYCVYTSLPRNTSMQIGSSGGPKDEIPQNLPPPPEETEEEDNETYSTIESLTKLTRNPGEQELQRPSPLKPPAPSESDIYDYLPSPEDTMRAAEWKMAQESFEREFVGRSQRRKLSLPKTDLNDYDRF